MEMSYLGIVEWVFNQVLSRIFLPVFDFITSVLSYVMGFIFNELLGPVILPILQMMFHWYMMVTKFFYALYLYRILKWILSIVDFIETAFDIFIGLEPVIYYPAGKGGGVKVEGSLLEILFNMSAVRNAFWIITFSGVGIAMLLTIYGVARSSFDLDFENKKPVGHVLTQMFKSLVGAFLVPFLAVSLIQISLIILTVLNGALSLGNSSENSTLGSTIFVLSSTSAAYDNDDNLAVKKLVPLGDGIKLEMVEEINPDFDLLAPPRKDFYENDVFNNYKNILKVMFYFNPAKFDFGTGMLTGIILMVIMAICLLTFIRRLFEIIFLYLVSPYFVAMIPLDDGEKFKHWLSMFSGKLFTGYGTVVIMKIYLMLCPLFAGGQIQLTTAGLETRFIMQMIFILGGGWTVLKSGNILTELINATAARAEQSTMRTAQGFMSTGKNMVMAPVKMAAQKVEEAGLKGISHMVTESLSPSGGGRGRRPGQVSTGKRAAAGSIIDMRQTSNTQISKNTRVSAKAQYKSGSVHRQGPKDISSATWNLPDHTKNKKEDR